MGAICNAIINKHHLVAGRSIHGTSTIVAAETLGI
jgi:hypothetical protein